MENNQIDLSPYYLLIGTPSADGKPDDDYARSLSLTKELIERHGGKCDSFKTRHISDISLARAKLLAFFLKHEKATHLLMIDQDQAWPPEEVAYMLLLNRHFLAAVSCKKVLPPEYAFNMHGDDGRLVPMYHELETNVASIPYVGGAFIMITRECAEKLVMSYPELEYITPEDTVECAIFDPVILTENGQKRRLSDDYALCYRWRKIGGKVEVKLDVRLAHIGTHRFEGSLVEHLTKTEPGFSPTLEFIDGEAKEK